MSKQSRELLRYAAVIFGGLALAACGAQKGEEVYGSIRGNADLTLSASNHPHGYGQRQCYYCHVKANIHQVDRIGSGALPAAIALSNTQGIASCRNCHGANGVTP